MAIEIQWVKKCDRYIDFNRVQTIIRYIENLKEYEKERVEVIRDIKYKEEKLKSVVKKDSYSELNYDITIYQHQRKLNDIKLKQSQRIRKRLNEKLNIEFPKAYRDEFKYDITSDAFKNVIIGYTVHKDWAIVGIYHNVVSKVTNTISMLFNSEVDYFNPAYIFNNLVSKANFDNSWNYEENEDNTTKSIEEFDYDKIMQPRTVVHCKTKDQAKELLTWADSKGLKWYSGRSYLDNYIYFKDICYDLYEGVHSTKTSDMTINCNILSFEDVKYF